VTRTSAAIAGTPADRAASAFVELAGRDPEGVWVAPGRVNVIGEHLDYNLGHVLPIAIGQSAAVAVGRRGDDCFRVVSTAEAGTVEVARSELHRATGWSAYLLGTIWALADAGLELPGLDVALASDVPPGAGLSSSAALECALALALDELAAAGLSRPTLAELARRAENEVVGAPVGVMDQRASLEGRAGHAVFLDCRSGSVELVPMPLGELGLALAVVDSGVRHRHADGAYRNRREACERAARRLGVGALREATEADLERLASEPELQRRTRHVVSEERRVVLAADLLRAGDVAAIGPLLTASHVSLRDDFEVSVAELDAAVEGSLAAGALGARLTGGGFGGAAIALVAATALPDLEVACRESFARLGAAPPGVVTVVPADGAHRVR
jgi:galactokinase